MNTLQTVRNFNLSLILGSALAFTACSGDGRPLQEAVETNQLDLQSLSIVQPTGLRKELFVNPGEQINFSILASNENGAVPLSVADRRWSVNNPAVASIDGNGKFIGIVDGSVIVSLQIGGLSANFPVTVAQGELAEINPIQGDPIEGADSLERCLPKMYSATGEYRHTFSTDSNGQPTTSTRGLLNIGWTVKNPEMGSASDQLNGTTSVVAFNAGMLELEATVGDKSATKTITVENNLQRIDILPPEPEVMEGSTLQLSAFGTYTRDGEESSSNITQSVNWSVPTDNGTATVSNLAPDKGLVSGIADGNPDVTATCGDDIESVKNIVVVEDNGAGSNQLAFEGGERQTILRSQGDYQLRVSTGSEYNKDKEVTKDNNTTWSVEAGNNIAKFQSVVKGIITPLQIGKATIKVVNGEAEAFLILTVD